MALKMALPVSPFSILSRCSKVLMKKGREKMFISGITGDELMVDSYAQSITPLATIWGDLSWAPLSNALPK